MEPSPAAAHPSPGPSTQAASSTAQSPRFTYPPMGEGTRITVVITAARAANREARTSFFTFSSGIIAALLFQACSGVGPGMFCQAAVDFCSELYFNQNWHERKDQNTTSFSDQMEAELC